MALSATPAWLGCSSKEAPATQVGEARETFEIPAELGGSYDFEVVRADGKEVTPENAKFLTFEVEDGATFASVMRMHAEGSMDPYLALYPPLERERVALSEGHQAAVPMGREDDAVIIHRARKSGGYGLLAADRDLDADASFQVDLIALDVDAPALDLGRTNPALRALNGALRKDDARVQSYIESGALSEGDSGLLSSNPKAVASLKERAELSDFVAQQNKLRTQLFAEHVRANNASSDDPVDPELAAQVGALLGALWRELRSGTHAL